jgi:uncharacterized protein
MEQEGPVTVVIRHRVKKGKEADFEGWLRGITAAAAALDGYLGYHVIRPADPRRPEYLILFRFETFAKLEVWESSETRHQWLDRLEPLVVHPPTLERHTGLEVWFTPVPGHAPPPRWKMVAVTLLAIYPLIMLTQLLLGPLMADWPMPLRSLATASLLVCVMTYAAMPLLTGLFSQWLNGPPTN